MNPIACSLECHLVMASAAPTFQQAMEITATWLQQWENEEISDEVLADRVGEIIASRDGARGFFVVSLAGDSALMDRLPDPVVGQLRAGGAGVVDLTVRNLAMSSAMALHHRRQGDAAQQAGSERVTARCTELLRQLEPADVKERLEQLLEAALDNRGDDVSFLEKRGYDAEQRQAISTGVYDVADT